MIRNSDGFTMIGTIVSLGIISLMFGALSDMLVLSTKGQRNHAIRVEFDQVVETVRRALDNEVSCTPSVLGESMAKSIVIRDPLDAGRVLAEAGKRYPAGWTLQNIALTEVAPIPGQAGAYRVSVVLEGLKDQRLVLGSPVMKSRIADIYLLAPAGKIEKCFGSDRWFMTAEANCRMLGGEWKGDKPGAQCIVFGSKS